MMNRLAALISSLFVLVSLLSLALPRFITDPQTRTLYVGFQDIGTDAAGASVDRVSQTVLYGVRPPFVPVGVVETHRVQHETVVVVPFVNLKLGSWSSDERWVGVRLIDGEDQDGELRYWFFPEDNKPPAKSSFIEDVEQQVQGMNLPDEMGESFSKQVDALYCVGDPIEPARRDEMISLLADALRGSEVAWAGEMLKLRQASRATRTSTGFGGVIIYGVLCVLVASLAGVLTWFRMKRASNG